MVSLCKFPLRIPNNNNIFYNQKDQDRGPVTKADNACSINFVIYCI